MNTFAAFLTDLLNEARRNPRTTAIWPELTPTTGLVLNVNVGHEFALVDIESGHLAVLCSWSLDRQEWLR